MDITRFTNTNRQTERQTQTGRGNLSKNAIQFHTFFISAKLSGYEVRLNKTLKCHWVRIKRRNV